MRLRRPVGQDTLEFRSHDLFDFQLDTSNLFLSSLGEAGYQLDVVVDNQSWASVSLSGWDSDGQD